MSRVIEHLSTSPEQTIAVGRLLGELLKAGDFVALCGPLGSGKTQFVKGLAAGLGVAADEPVVSPTFVLIREYSGRLKLYHVDAYRLSGGPELLALGLVEMSEEPEAVVAVEWADRTPEAIPAGACWIELEHADVSARRLRIRWRDRRQLAELRGRLPR